MSWLITTPRSVPGGTSTVMGSERGAGPPPSAGGAGSNVIITNWASSGVSPGREVSTLTRSGAHSTVVLGNRLYCDSAVMRLVP